VLGVVLTGMGSDGRAGAGEIRTAGGRVIVQDQATSVVWGMPGAIASAGLADEILPLDRIAETVLKHLPAVPSLSGGARP
jgi:two-component system chemotaxis response regulator CheB